ncbi:MAG TPA: DUF2750 domain-containing protein [Terracidiphilus sp.]|nr:DUF2750 domain-containing protein [Terracidiphilus sp.]
MTYLLHPDHFANVIGMSPRERYEYFVKRAADWGELWGLYQDGWAQLGDGEEREHMPIWPHEEFARHYATGDWRKFEPKRIDLREWLESWTPRLIDEGRGVAVFPVRTGKCTTAAPDRLLHDLVEELEQLG